MRSLRNPISLRRKPTAFTLVELIISIGMVLILMAGVVKVFKYATDAVGAGLAVSDIVRAQRSLATLIPADTQGLSINTNSCPAILLDSQQNDPNLPGAPNAIVTTSNGDFGVVGGPIYLDKNDQATLAANPNNLTTAQLQAAEQYRQDSFSFFTRGSFARQTGNDGIAGTGGTFVSPISSSWAWIWYGQLWLPTNQFSATGQPSFFLPDNKTPSYPGIGDISSNPNNFYARQSQLGRVAILTMPKNFKTGITANPNDIVLGYWPSGVISPQRQSFIQDQPPSTAAAPPPKTLQSLAYGSLSRDYKDGVNITATPATDPGVWTVQQSRYDLAGIDALGTGDPFIDYFIPRLNSAAVPPLVVPQTYVPNWYVPVTDFISTAAITYQQSLNYRFQANPFPVRNTSSATLTALISSQAAQTVPLLAPACVRFYVEYAGDFVNQNSNGTVNTTRPGWNVAVATGANPYQPDGTDFYVDQSGARHIRWYGLPRSVRGGVVDTNVAGTNVGGVEVETADVLPLAYYCSSPPSVSSPITAPFESGVPAPAPVPTYSPQFNHYICAWGSTAGTPRPTMFRITAELIDTNGRLNSPRVIQYIVPVAQQ
jgi:type II secretory pathway pseudopilin PulG